MSSGSSRVRNRNPDIFDMSECLERLCDEADGFGYSDMGGTTFEQSEQNDQFPEHLSLALRSLSGNNRCIDCLEYKDLQWASVSFGIIMCEECAFEHISSGLAENLTNVRSLTRNAWNLDEVIALLEGGNAQFLKCIGVSYPVDNNSIDPSKEKKKGGKLSSREAEPSDFQKYKKKNAKLYVKKLSDRVEVVTGTFGTKSFNSRQGRGIEDPTFKPMRRLSQISRESNDLGSIGSFDPRASDSKSGSFEPRASLGIRQSFLDPGNTSKSSFDRRTSFGIRASFMDSSVNGRQ